MVKEEGTREEGSREAAASKEVFAIKEVARPEPVSNEKAATQDTPRIRVRPVPASKRVLDLLILGCLIPFAALVFLVAAVWVWAVSRGRVFFVQERVGRGGNRFRCYKLRTMKEGCASGVHERHLHQLVTEGDKPMNKLDTSDPRLIAGARVIRALGIDELPQLINVLRGEMSIVGPRPCIPYEADHYQDWQRERFAGLPGLTGLWQVRGKNKTTFKQMIQLDIKYLQNQSVWLDLWILMATPGAVATQLLSTLRNRSQRSRDPLSGPASMPISTTDSSGVVG
jgi:lipopolysaccharide/colanic/teichoic acid biosynthesis glycosyltransferase